MTWGELTLESRRPLARAVVSRLASHAHNLQDGTINRYLILTGIWFADHPQSGGGFFNDNSPCRETDMFNKREPGSPETLENDTPTRRKPDSSARLPRRSRRYRRIHSG